METKRICPNCNRKDMMFNLEENFWLCSCWYAIVGSDINLTEIKKQSKTIDQLDSNGKS